MNPYLVSLGKALAVLKTVEATLAVVGVQCDLPKPVRVGRPTLRGLLDRAEESLPMVPAPPGGSWESAHAMVIETELGARHKAARASLASLREIVDALD